MPFAKIMDGEHVRLRHVTEDDAETILEAWGGHLADAEGRRRMMDRLRWNLAQAMIRAATWLLPRGVATYRAGRGEAISSTWRHHRPKTLEEQREKLRRFVDDEDRHQWLIIRKASEEIVGCIGLETNKKKDQSGDRRYTYGNHRVARLTMLLFRENPWDHHCEKEAIRLLLKETFRQEFVARDGERFKICDVIVLVNVDDEVTTGLLLSMDFVYSKMFLTYHGRKTVMMDYSPPDLDPTKC